MFLGCYGDNMLWTLYRKLSMYGVYLPDSKTTEFALIELIFIYLISYCCTEA